MRAKVSAGSSTSSNQPISGVGPVTVGVSTASNSLVTSSASRVVSWIADWALRKSGAGVANPRSRIHAVTGRIRCSRSGATGCMQAKLNHMRSNSGTGAAP